MKCLICERVGPLLNSHRFHWAGLKSMVVQGVKNPMVDLQSLEDKMLDEVMLKNSASQHEIIINFLFRIYLMLVLLSSGLRLINGSLNVQLQ